MLTTYTTDTIDFDNFLKQPDQDSNLEHLVRSEAMIVRFTIGLSLVITQRKAWDSNPHGTLQRRTV